MKAEFRFFLLWVSVVGLSCLSTADIYHNTTSNRGKVFLLAFPVMLRNTNISLSIAARVDSEVTLQAYVPGINRTYHIHHGITEITIDRNLFSQNGINNKSLLLQSTSDVAVFAMYRPDQHLEEVMLAMPIPSLSTSYVVPSYFQYKGYNASLIIAAPQDQTILQIRLRSTTTIAYNSHIYSDGDIIHLSLQKFQTFVLNSEESDFSGTIVESSAPVAVFVVNECTEIPVNAFHCDFITAQLLPVDRWGSLVIVPPLCPRHAYMIRMYAYYNNTHVSTYNSTISQNKVINNGEFWEIHLGNEYFVVTSNTSIQVVQYSYSQDFRPANDNGDPFMSPVPAVEQFSSEYMFFAEHTQSYPFSVYVAVTIDTTQLAGLRLDGFPLQIVNVLQVSRPSEAYSVLTTRVQRGPHTLNHTNTGVRFGALVYGFAYAVGYGYPAGMTFKENGNLTCYACLGVQKLHFCDQIELCSTNEVCFAQMFETHHRHVRYNSGCVKQDFCAKGEKLLCNECCTTNYCNNKGCGDIGLSLRTNRGPMCLDCRHFEDPRECDKVTVCSKLEVCSIEEFRWQETESNFVMGCKPRGACSPTTAVARRAIPICHSCCEQDYCNANCTHQYTPPIIG